MASFPSYLACLFPAGMVHLASWSFALGTLNHLHQKRDHAHWLRCFWQIKKKETLTSSCILKKCENSLDYNKCCGSDQCRMHKRKMQKTFTMDNHLKESTQFFLNLLCLLTLEIRVFYLILLFVHSYYSFRSPNLPAILLSCFVLFYLENSNWIKMIKEGSCYPFCSIRDGEKKNLERLRTQYRAQSCSCWSHKKLFYWTSVG